MATELIELNGECAWANGLRKLDEKYKNWSVDLYMTRESWDLFESYGLQNEVKKDKDGREYVRFRRPSSKVIKDELVKFSEPRIYMNKKDFEGKLIPNGSDVTIRLWVYDTPKGKASRLEDMRINKLAEMPDNPDYMKKELAPF